MFVVSEKSGPLTIKSTSSVESSITSKVAIPLSNAMIPSIGSVIAAPPALIAAVRSNVSSISPGPVRAVTVMESGSPAAKASSESSSKR